jgi:hypothetical protein
MRSSKAWRILAITPGLDQSPTGLKENSHG